MQILLGFCIYPGQIFQYSGVDYPETSLQLQGARSENPKNNQSFQSTEVQGEDNTRHQPFLLR